MPFHIVKQFPRGYERVKRIRKGRREKEAVSGCHKRKIKKEKNVRQR
jgi:hypothetical protein